MTSVHFYHLTATPLERALPKLLEKALERKHRVLVTAQSQERVEQLDQALWTYHPNSFLPHGSARDGRPERQPVFLACDFDAPNAPDLLVVTDGRQPPDVGAYARILDIFDGNDPAATAAARARWAEYAQAGYALSYLRQTAQGGWEKAA